MIGPTNVDFLALAMSLLFIFFLHPLNLPTVGETDLNAMVTISTYNLAVVKKIVKIDNSQD